MKHENNKRELSGEKITCGKYSCGIDKRRTLGVFVDVSALKVK
jgi:hypothetical protein